MRARSRSSCERAVPTDVNRKTIASSARTRLVMLRASGMTQQHSRRERRQQPGAAGLLRRVGFERLDAVDDQLDERSRRGRIEHRLIRLAQTMAAYDIDQMPPRERGELLAQHHLSPPIDRKGIEDALGLGINFAEVWRGAVECGCGNLARGWTHEGLQRATKRAFEIHRREARRPIHRVGAIGLCRLASRADWLA